jgi:hypothetical protein
VLAGLFIRHSKQHFKPGEPKRPDLVTQSEHTIRPRTAAGPEVHYGKRELDLRSGNSSCEDAAREGIAFLNSASLANVAILCLTGHRTDSKPDLAVLSRHYTRREV